MASYNSLLTSNTTTGDTQSTLATSIGQVPAKFFSSGHFAITCTEGVSGTIGVQIIGAVGGATYAIAGRTNISGAGSFPIPLISYVGSSGSVALTGFPRPLGAEITGVSIAATRAVGYTASIYLCGEY
jgi:hypothetical protein